MKLWLCISDPPQAMWITGVVAVLCKGGARDLSGRLTDWAVLQSGAHRN